jgi:hypothetical protein
MSIKVLYSSVVYLEYSAVTYAGHTVWNRHNEFVDGANAGGGVGRDRPREDCEVNRDTHTEAISYCEAEAIFREQDKHKNKHSRRGRNHYLLSCLITCKCHAHVDGDSGYYRCHDRCGVCSV